MAATSLKLPDELKRRIAALADEAHTTPHAFMVAALAREAERQELRARFAADAAASEAQAHRSGRTVALHVAFDYLDGSLAGRKLRRPRTRRWRASK
ncbi:MAG: hypothetical protein JSR67_08360 [Proteobacteria bacterium]|nr:hypothetical protein [Pseudomonadota bacterium]